MWVNAHKEEAAATAAAAAAQEEEEHSLLLSAPSMAGADPAPRISAAAASSTVVSAAGDGKAPVDRAVTTAGAVAAAAAAAAPTSSIDFFDDELDEERAARQAAEAAAAAAAAVAAAEAAAAEAAAAAAAAARRPPPAVARGVKPRLFVIDRKTGSGYEVLSAAAVEQYTSYADSAAAAATASADGEAARETSVPAHALPIGCRMRHEQQQAVGAAEPGTICHSFLCSYSPVSPLLQPLELADPAVAVPVQVDPASSLVSLRRTDVFVPAQQRQQQQQLCPAQGLRLPRVAALNPGYVLSIGQSAAVEPAAGTVQHTIGSGSSLLATRLHASQATNKRAGGPFGSSSVASEVLVVREVLELPQLTPELQSQAEAILQACSSWRAAQEAELVNRLPPEDPRSEALQHEAAEVAALITAAQQQGGVAQVVPVQPWPAATMHGSGSSSGGSRLEAVRGQVVAEQAAAAAAAARAAAEAEAKAAAEAAAKRKPYK